MASDKHPFPAVGFYYQLDIPGLGSASAAFQEVSGVEVTVETEPIAEAGLNEYSHRVPKRTSYNNLVLKRGLMADDSAMQEWVKGCTQEGLLWFIDARDVTLTLMDETGAPILSWNFVNAYPVKWSASGFNSMESAIVIESIELCYSYWKFA